MSRKSRQAAAEQAASEAGRALAQHKAALQSEQVEPAAEPESEGSQGDRPLPTPRNDPHLEAMKEIEARQLERMGVQDEHVETPTETKYETQPVVQNEGAEIPAETPVEVSAEPEMVDLKVDGEIIRRPKAEVDAEGGVAAAQIRMAYEKRLKTANEAAAESKQMIAAMQQFMQRMQPQQTQPQPSRDDLIKAKVQQIQYGTPDEAAAALREIMQLNAPQQVDPNLIVQQAMIRFGQQQAAQQFKAAHNDILANPLAAKMAVLLENEGLQQGIPSDFGAFYTGIGNQLRGVFGKPNQPAENPVTQAPTSAPASDREARKASITTLPRASARAAPPEDPKPETREQVLAEMRKARGLPTG